VTLFATHDVIIGPVFCAALYVSVSVRIISVCLYYMCVIGLMPGLHTCFACRKADHETEMCAVSSCGRFYHRSCALRIETTQLHKDRLHCPLHTCATCFADADDDDIECLRQQAVRGTCCSLFPLL